jgi:hypothetical protein
MWLLCLMWHMIQSAIWEILKLLTWERKWNKTSFHIHCFKLKYLSYIEKKPIQGGLGQSERYLRNHKGEWNQLIGKISLKRFPPAVHQSLASFIILPEFLSNVFSHTSAPDPTHFLGAMEKRGAHISSSNGLHHHMHSFPNSGISSVLLVTQMYLCQ